MKTSMKAAYIKAPFEVELRDVELRELAADEVLIQVQACGICGTDLTSAAVGATDWEPVGHEVAGIVEQVGSRVEHTKLGDTVALETGTSCRTCDKCRNGRSDLCNKGPTFWLKNAMGFAEYIIAPMACVVPYSGLSFEQAALLEPLGVALDLVYTADLKLNDDVLIVGLGPIGLMALRLAKAMGARKIYAAARSHSKRRIELARQWGADEIIYTDQVSLEQHPYADGGVDRVLVTAPPATIPSALDTLKVGGIAAFLGIEYGAGASITFDANAFHFKKLQLRASHASPALYFPRGVELLRAGVIDGQSLISHTFRLEQFPEAMNLLRTDKESTIKMVMVNA